MRKLWENRLSRVGRHNAFLPIFFRKILALSRRIQFSHSQFSDFSNVIIVPRVSRRHEFFSAQPNQIFCLAFMSFFPFVRIQDGETERLTGKWEGRDGEMSKTIGIFFWRPKTRSQGVNSKRSKRGAKQHAACSDAFRSTKFRLLLDLSVYSIGCKVVVLLRPN